MSWMPLIVAALIASIVFYQLYMWIATHRLKGRQIHYQESSPGKVIFYFYRRNCSFCRNMVPIINALSERYRGRVIKVDMQEHQKMADEFGIRAVPSTVLVEDSVIRDALVGMQPEKRLDAFLAG
jgi:thioredoxin 1